MKSFSVKILLLSKPFSKKSEKIFCEISTKRLVQFSFYFSGIIFDFYRKATEWKVILYGIINMCMSHEFIIQCMLTAHIMKFNRSRSKGFFLSKIFRLKFISRESSKNALELENFADEIALLLLLFLNPTKFPTYSGQNSATRSSQTEHVLHLMASCIVFLLKERGLVSWHISDTLVVSWHILYDTYSSLLSLTDPVTQIKAGLSLGPGKGPGSSFKHPSTRNTIQQ